MDLQQELHSLINSASADQLLSTTYSTESPLHDQFVKFLGLSYADWISLSTNSQRTDTDDEIKKFKHAIEDTNIIKLNSINQKDKHKYFASFEKKPFQGLIKLFSNDSDKLKRQLCNNNTTKDVEIKDHVSDLLSSQQTQLWQYNLDDNTHAKNTFVKKLQLCSVKFNFNTKNSLESQVIKKKAKILLELAEYVASGSWYNEYDSDILPAVFHFIRSNLFRTLPAGAHTTNIPDEEFDDIAYAFTYSDLLWEQLQLVYDITLRVVIDTSIDKKKMVKHFENNSFIYQLMQLFKSPDNREREYLKTILHRIYGRFMPLRQKIRKHMAHYCYSVIYEGYGYEFPNGIAELLEIYCSIVHGFGHPVKIEHLQFCRNVLVPLHKCCKLQLFHEQLVACCVQFVFQDTSTGLMILSGLIKFWPVQSTIKQEMFIAEFVNISNAMLNHPAGFSLENGNYKDVYVSFVNILIKCMQSKNVNLAERSLLVWSEDSSVQLMDLDKELFWPMVVETMLEINKNHSCESIKECNQELVQHLKGRDEAMFDKICQKYEYTIVCAYIWNVSSKCVFLNDQYIPNDIIVSCAIYYRYHFPIKKGDWI
eukprot:479828_1